MSTVPAMTGHILTHAFTGGRTWIGGNIGRSLLHDLEQIQPNDLVVLELSSFQLQRTSAVRWSPHIAVVTNLTPNHLDWHGTFAAYVAAKLHIVRFQVPGRDYVIVQDNEDMRRIFDHLHGDVSGVWRYSLDGDVPQAVIQSTAAVDCDDRKLRWPTLQLQVPGKHNRQNAAAALAVAHALDIPDDSAVAALASFEALPHRLQKVAEHGGIAWYDDSKSTTPEAALTALDAIEQPILLILGGYDKGSDLKPVAQAAAQRAKFTACIGVTGPGIAEAIRAAGGQTEYCEDLPRAVAACRARAQNGDAVLLSPACASWDQFVDYRVRGTQFAELARSNA